MVKKILLPLTTLTLFLSITTLAHAADCTSQDHADWNSPTTWSCGAIPAAGDNVIIAHDVSFTSNIAQINNLTINNGASLTQNNTNTQTIDGTLTINGTLTHGDNSTTQSFEVDFAAASATISSTGSINVDALGWDGDTNAVDGHGDGGGPSALSGGGAGAGYGGYGGRASVEPTGGDAYCNIENPQKIGSGGGGRISDGGAGGGLIILNVSGTLDIEGTISADGENGLAQRSGGGSGGGINITAGTITGTPSEFSFSGGNGQFDGAGGGGGGCAFIEATGASSLDPRTFSMDGGTGYAGGATSGGAGLVLHTDSGGEDIVYSINDNVSYTVTPLLSTLTLDKLYISSNSIIAPDSGTTLTLVNNDPFFFSGTPADGTGILRLNEGALTTPTSLTIQDVQLEMDETGNWTNSSSVDLIIGDGGILRQRFYTVSDVLNINSINIQSGGLLTHNENSTAQTHVLNISAGSIDIDPGGEINVDYLGYDGEKESTDGYGDGGGPSALSGGGAGAGYGGYGGRGSVVTTGGDAYCDIENPQKIGSGGGGRVSIGGAGGGLILLDVSGTLNIEGVVSADGENRPGQRSGGGSGGGINITAGTITGTPGEFSFTGGNGGHDGAGGGGGGCAFIEATGASSLDPRTFSMDGGTGYTGGATSGGAGLVFHTDSGGEDIVYSINDNVSYTITPLLSSITLDKLYISSNAIVQPDSGATLTLTDNDPFYFSDSQADGTGRLRINNGSFTSPNPFNVNDAYFEPGINGNWSNSASTTVNLGGNGIIRQLFFNTTTPLELGALNIQSGGYITHPGNTTDQTHIINITAGSIDLQSGSEINVDGLGYDGGVNPQDGYSPAGTSGGGESPSAGSGAGGAHGADGGDGFYGAQGGTAYCDLNNPQTMGAGGGGRIETGGSGGGLVLLSASSILNIDGDISANGVDGQGRGGGGAGGGINLSAPSITGNPSPASITADGGDAGASGAGGGGAGCISLSFSETNNELANDDFSSDGGSDGGSGSSPGGSTTYTENNLPSIVPEFRTIIYGFTMMLCAIALFLLMPKIKSQISP